MDLDQSENAFLVRQTYPVNSVQVFVPETLVFFMLVPGPRSCYWNGPQSTPLAFSSAGKVPGVHRATLRHPVLERSPMPGEGGPPSRRSPTAESSRHSP